MTVERRSVKKDVRVEKLSSSHEKEDDPKTKKISSGSSGLITLITLLLLVACGALFRRDIAERLSLSSSRLLADYGKSWKDVTVYENGASVGGVRIALDESQVASGAQLAAYLSNFVTVSGITLLETDSSGEQGIHPKKTIADRVFTGKGLQVETYADIEDGDRLYLVAPGLLFVWPFVKVCRLIHLKTKYDLHAHDDDVLLCIAWPSREHYGEAKSDRIRYHFGIL
jgi:hypothetical protein